MQKRRSHFGSRPFGSSLNFGRATVRVRSSTPAAFSSVANRRAAGGVAPPSETRRAYPTSRSSSSADAFRQPTTTFQNSPTSEVPKDFAAIVQSKVNMWRRRPRDGPLNAALQKKKLLGQCLSASGLGVPVRGAKKRVPVAARDVEAQEEPARL